jgi:hypothetical protein
MDANRQTKTQRLAGQNPDTRRTSVIIEVAHFFCVFWAFRGYCQLACVAAGKIRFL